MFLQHIKQNMNPKNTLYVSADNMYFADNSLIDLTDKFSKQGGKHLFIDEIHKYPNPTIYLNVPKYFVCSKNVISLLSGLT